LILARGNGLTDVRVQFRIEQAHHRFGKCLRISPFGDDAGMTVGDLLAQSADRVCHDRQTEAVRGRNYG